MGKQFLPYPSALLAFACGALMLFPNLAPAQIRGIWNTTTLSRIDVNAINAPKLVPEHIVEIADGTYWFKGTGDFIAGEIKGTWKQIGNQYTVTVNTAYLENQFRLKLEKIPGMIVNDIILVKKGFLGNELDKGIWGSEYFLYKLDTTKDGRREVVSVAMSVRAAGHPYVAKQMANPRTAQTKPHSVMDAAVNAVNQYFAKLEQPANTDSSSNSQ